MSEDVPGTKELETIESCVSSNLLRVSLSSTLESVIKTYKEESVYICSDEKAVLGTFDGQVALGLAKIGKDSDTLKKFKNHFAKNIPFLDGKESILTAVEKLQKAEARYGLVKDKDDKITGCVFLSSLAAKIYLVLKNKIIEEKDNLEKIRVRDDYLGIVSHDIRSPLGVITVCCDYLNALDKGESAFNDEQRDFVIRIKRNAAKALALVTSLLDIGRLNSGVSLSVESVFLPSYLESIVANMQILAMKKKISIVHKYETPIQVAIDSKRFQQVVENLIGNAIKFSPKGKNIYVSCTLNPKNLKDHVSIAIRDEGYGIPKEKLKEIFEKYKQNDVMIAKELGVGLGLSIAQQFVHLHKGWIEVESEENAGSTFFIIIPNAKIATVKEQEMADNQLRILVAEDDKDVLDFIKDKLEDYGAIVFGAQDGDKAIDMFRLHHPHLVISDLKMPKTDGFELIHNIRSNGHKVPYILTSGRYDGDNLRKAKEIFNADLVLAKPFEEDELVEAIRTCIKNYNLSFVLKKKT